MLPCADYRNRPCARVEQIDVTGAVYNTYAMRINTLPLSFSLSCCLAEVGFFYGAGARSRVHWGMYRLVRWSARFIAW